MKSTGTSLVVLVLTWVIGIFVLAACQPITPPSVSVADQVIENGSVTVAGVVSSGPGWIVIHTQADGKPGPIIGYAPVANGLNRDVAVQVDAGSATETLYAMLHSDAGTVGTWEFPGGSDTPVAVGGQVVTPSFHILAGQDSAGMPEMSGATLMVSSSEELGQFLVDGKGMALYLFLNDEPNTSNCYEGCAQRWPPLLVEGEAELADGVDAALTGVTERTDGTMQLTYNGWPLYYWVDDQAPGDTDGQGRGDVWYVVSPAGEIVQ